MAGKRLLDVAALLNASRGVLQKHAALRSTQLEVYSRTSALAQGVRNQTDRVTETIKAASFLASRLNEDAPAWTSEEHGNHNKGDPIPSNKSTSESPRPNPANGIDQDHFYGRSTGNFAVNEDPDEGLGIKQASADRYPLPDGTIPPRQFGLDSARYLDRDILSDNPHDELAKTPWDVDGTNPMSRDEFTTPRLAGNSSSPEITKRPAEAQIPSKVADPFHGSSSDLLIEGHDEDSFSRYSNRSSTVMSSPPRAKLPQHTSNAQGRSAQLSAGFINSDLFYHAENQEAVQVVPEQEQTPTGINTNVFHSPRVARILGARIQEGQREDINEEEHANTSVDPALLPRDKDQKCYTVRHPSESYASSSQTLTPTEDDVVELANDMLNEATQSQSEVGHMTYELRESKVPSTRLSRMWNYGGLAVGMFGGAISESFRRISGNGGQGSYMLTAGNMDRLVTRLSRMRGAALKLGQIISFQDTKMLPGPIQDVLQRVQDRADYMPPSQRNKVLTTNLGPDWRGLFTTFDEKPIAAASIGQVHSAVLRSSGARVAVKIQYPGVADSIDSDLSNLEILLTASRLLPKGLFLDKTIANARIELAWECDYLREAECGRRFEQLLADEKDIFIVPKVYPEASGKQVLTMEFMDGVGVTRDQSFSQEQKDWIGTQILRLCLREITEFKFMQTDPNWTNFLYNAQTNRLELLDFGASREYPEEFITEYTKLLAAASRADKATVRDLSINLGYLTGHESTAMLNAHIASILTLAEPFLHSSPEVYDFKDQTITDRVKEQIPLMIRERLAPPPEETYSLHRKLSGAFLLCARLGSRVRCRELFEDSMSRTGIL